MAPTTAANSPKSKFTEGERVLCFHGPLIYEAKCIKVSPQKDKPTKYYIHYAGWNKNWDEWVPESRVLKYNDANIARQQQLQKEHNLSATGKGATKSKLNKRKLDNVKDPDSRASTPSRDVTSPPPTPRLGKDGSTGSTTPATTSFSAQDDDKRKRRRVADVECEEQYINKIEVKIQFPNELNLWLVDDWEWIMLNGKLVILPCELSVDKILDNYIEYKRATKSHNANREFAVLDLASGLKEYFNTTLGTQLLYRAEQQQHDLIRKDYPEAPMSAIYGAEHLLRLLTKIGSFLAYTPLDEKDIQILMGYFQDFFKFMIKNSSTLFNSSHYATNIVDAIKKAT